MKFLFFASVSLITLLSSCSGKKSDTQSETGYLEGTYRMTSTQTVATDTTVYPSATQTIYRIDTNTGSGFAGTLTVTKNNMQLNGFSYTINNAGETKTYVASSGQTSVQPFSTTLNNVTAPSVAASYTLSATKDSVTISNVLDIVQSRYDNPGKYKVTVNGNTVTFSMNYYTNTSSGGYNTRKRFITTTVYQKQ